jgi:hypothetical protein
MVAGNWTEKKCIYNFSGEISQLDLFLSVPDKNISPLVSTFGYNSLSWFLETPRFTDGPLSVFWHGGT